MGESRRERERARARAGATEGNSGKYFAIGIGIFALGTTVLLVTHRGWRRFAKSRGWIPDVYEGGDALFVRRLSLGVDWRARGALQARLKELAEGGDTGSPEGLVALLRATTEALRAAKISWLYVSHEALDPLPPRDAEARYRELEAGLRAQFRHEVVRSADGEVRREDAPTQRAQAHEGEGAVVVSLLVATRRPGVAMPARADAAAIDEALAALAELSSHQLMVLTIVWSPAEEEDRMSTAELEQHYPDLALIDPASIAGRVFCVHCAGPFALELPTCPHCGAPADASRENRAPRGPAGAS